MKSLESKIPGFYDILEDEVEKTHYIQNIYSNLAKKSGFFEMKTCMVELRERYLNSTNVHFSKIFEVHRVKENTKYALQSDLAMSMSRFVADLAQKPPLKMFQVGTMFRDRPASLPGFRREFQQILIGSWAIESLYVDAEIIAITWEGLKKIEGIVPRFIQLSNVNIFNSISSNLASEIRFSSRGIDLIDGFDLNTNDVEILKKLYEIDRITLEVTLEYFEKIEKESIKNELSKIIDIYKYLLFISPGCPVYFSLKNLSGTGHYSGLNYKVFISKEYSEEVFDVADGGRIDDLCYKFNKSNVPGVCMGIGITLLSQLTTHIHAVEKIVVLIDAKEEIDMYVNYINEIKNHFSTFDISVLHIKRKKWKNVFKHSYYKDCGFVMLSDKNIEMRNIDTNINQQFKNQLKLKGI